MKKSILFGASVLLIGCTPVAQDDACRPYLCKDGTEVARCAADGTVINYFAPPCLTHGGEVTESEYGSSSIGGITFEVPALWGISETSEDGRSATLDFPALQNVGQAADQLTVFTVRTLAYDEAGNRYERYQGYGGDEVEIDLLNQKAETEAKATTIIAGFPAMMTEWYDPSSAYVARSYRFFTPTHRIELMPGYSILHLYEAAYDERNAVESISISELVAEDIGSDFNDPFTNLRKLYPEQTTGLAAFFADVDSVIASMRISAN